MKTELNIILHDRFVGTIANVPGDVNVVTIDPAFAADVEAPALSLRAFRDATSQRYHDVLRPTRTLAHPYFSNLLPEGPLREYLARHARVKPVRDFPLLELLGNDLPGAIVLLPADRSAALDADRSGVEQRAARDERVLRFSLAGVQLKFSATGDPKRGLTIPASGMGGEWIIKLPDERFDGVPENEFSMMTFAREVGIDVPSIQLVESHQIAGLPADVRRSGSAYAIERFDRVRSERVHTEDFAQVNTIFPAQKYNRFNADMLVEQVATLLDEEAALEVVGRIVFSIGIGNGDMHAKNWSIVYPDRRTPQIAPAYDYLSTIVYLPDEDFGINLAGTKAYAQIDASRFERLALHARLSRAIVLKRVREMVMRMQEVWPKICMDMPLRAHHRDAIAAHMARQPLFAAR